MTYTDAHGNRQRAIRRLRTDLVVAHLRDGTRRYWLAPWRSLWLRAVSRAEAVRFLASHPSLHR